MTPSKDPAPKLQLRRGRTDRDLLGVQIAQDLVASIRRRGLKAGDPIPSEASLADEYGVSQRVVRDALRALSQQGAIETRQGKRAVVSELRPVAVQGYFELALGADESARGELLELRQVIESRAAGLAASAIEPDDLDRVADLLDRIEAVAELDDRIAADLEFHAAIIGAAGNRFFDSIAASLGDVLAADRRHGQEYTEAKGRDHRASDEEHRVILEALRAGDSAAAEKAMWHHLEQVRQRLHPTA